MQILKLKLKDDTIKLRVDDLDDLWTIYNIVQAGDMVIAKTFRREKVDVENSRPERGEKKPVVLGVRVEKVEFHKYVNIVRLIGKIERGVDIGSYHTINLEPGSIFSLVRTWKKTEIHNLKEAVRDSRRPLILVVSLDEGEASFAIVRQRGVDFINDISVNIPGKRDTSAREKARREFYSKVLQAVLEIAASRHLSEVLVVGPQLIRAGFKDHVDKNIESLAAINISYDTCYSPGRTGIYEALRRGSVDRIVSSGRVSMELAAVEAFLEKIATNGPAVYGLSEVSQAVQSGAVETLLMTDKFFREKRHEGDALIRGVEGFSGQHLIISTDHEGGTKLQSLGGLGAVLRYALSGPDTRK